MELNQSKIQKVGIIAGAGTLPRHVYDACIKKGIECVVVGLEGQTSSTLFKGISYETIPVYNISKILRLLQMEGATHIVLAGRVERAHLSRLLLDLKGAVLLAKIMKNGLNDNAVLSTVIKFLEKEGFTIIPPEMIARDIVIRKGVLTRTEPDKSAVEDIKKGTKILRNIAALDVGQALVIQSGLVLGVEAAEGTDELIKRCGRIQQKDEPGAILVKISKPNQDRRVDLPCVGNITINQLKEYGMRGAAVEADSTLLLDGADTIKTADENNIFLIGF